MTTAPRSHPTPARHRPWPLCRQCSGVALDLGSVRTRAWIAGRGLILDVPTVTSPATGAVHPVRRGAIVDTPAAAVMLQDLLARRLSRIGSPLVIVATPVLDGVAFRSEVRTALEVLRPRTVLTVPAARAVAAVAGVDLSYPLLVVDIGAHLTEVVLLTDGSVADARRTMLGTSDLTDTASHTQITDAVVGMVTTMVRQDRTSLTLEALRRGVLLAGGGALRPEITYGLSGRLHAPVRPAPAPHTAAVRGAATLLEAAHSHPSTTGAVRTVLHLN
ncbi:rod shape-determining protein [Streptomyces sp. NPDC052051]|uniref:rod shape-determining protein n=1 Tax=Streptomyces sp. NPDC052051 TaxID=3154649 RepID=UPI00341C5FDD